MFQFLPQLFFAKFSGSSCRGSDVCVWHLPRASCERAGKQSGRMASTREYTLDLLEVDVEVGPSVVECLLHCIFFVRAFGIVEPVDAEISALDVCYARVNDAALDNEIKDRVRAFQDLQVAGKSTGEITVSFFEKKMRSSGWFVATQSEQIVCWEKWDLRFRFTGMGPRSEMGLSPQRKAALAEEVTRRINYILKVTRTQQDHLPQISQSKPATLPFPYAIDTPHSQGGASVWDSLFKRN